MVIKIPRQHDFPKSLTEKIFEQTDFSLPEWEICVPRQDDLAWSIVLSSLITTNYRDRNDFSNRLKALTGSDENAKLVNKSIRRFNPFRNRYSCFFDEVLKKVVNKFKINLNWRSLTNVSDKLSAASKALDFPILLITQDHPENEHYQIYNKNAKRRQDMITLLSSSMSTDDDSDYNRITVYNFMISHSLGSRMKTAALLYFLKEANLSKKQIRKLKSVANKENHFLIAILKCNYCDMIFKLYESPYLVSKISEAGYETDPSSRDSEGLSALNHALILGNFKMLYKLHYFAANNCFQSMGTYRNPDPSIVTNLLQIEEMILADLSKLKDFQHHEKYKEWNKIFEELLKFNRFLIEVSRKILKIKKELNYYESTEENIFEATQRRDIIVTVLDIYKDFFKAEQQEDIILSPLDDYILHRNYYNLIDMATAIIFFDNIIFLKERLTLKNKHGFSEIESSFFFSILYHIVFEKVDTLNVIKIPNSNMRIDIKSIYIFLLIKRLDNFDKMKKFSNVLRDTVISKQNVVRCIPECEINNILHSYSELKDLIHKDRLKHHIKTALKVKLTSIKSVLVIERVLQVIGEYITPESEDDFSFRRLLLLCLPKNISHTLHRLRHELSHLKGHTFPSKFEFEKNYSLFRSIQKEILEIQYHFKPVYHIVDLSATFYIMKQLENELKEMKNSVHIYTSLSPFYLDENVILFVESLPYYTFQNSKNFYFRFFKRVLDALQNDIMNESFWINLHDFENMKSQVMRTLRPLKWLLKLLQQCNVYNIASVLEIWKALKESNERNITVENFKQLTNIFLTECRNVFSTINVAEKRNRKKLKPLKSIENIEHFLKILKGFAFLTDEEKDKIKEEIPQTIRQSVAMKKELIHSIETNFSLNIDENFPDFEISYLSKGKMKEFRRLYECKDSQALAILKTPDPIEELEEIFSKNCVGKKKYEILCDKMKFSDETRKKLWKLVDGQRKKNPANNLNNLLNRILLLKNILIEENEEIFNSWVKVKSQKSRQFLVDKIVQCYLDDSEQQASVDMLLFDCMILFKPGKTTKNPWIKSSRLYSGINLRNVISHGSPLLESLCQLLDPEDLPSEVIKKMIQLIEAEDAIKAILELYELVSCDFAMLQKIINSEEKDEYCHLRDRIVKCDDWKAYTLLLPGNRPKDFDKQ